MLPLPLTNSDGSPFYAVPANAGPRTINYADLYAAGTYTDTNKGISVFAGTVDDPFFIDLGAAFDTANFRLLEGGPPVGRVCRESSPTPKMLPIRTSPLTRFPVMP